MYREIYLENINIIERKFLTRLDAFSRKENTSYIEEVKRGNSDSKPRFQTYLQIVITLSEAEDMWPTNLKLISWKVNYKAEKIFCRHITTYVKTKAYGQVAGESYPIGWWCLMA